MEAQEVQTHQINTIELLRWPEGAGCDGCWGEKVISLSRGTSAILASNALGLIFLHGIRTCSLLPSLNGSDDVALGDIADKLDAAN